MSRSEKACRLSSAKTIISSERAHIPEKVCRYGIRAASRSLDDSADGAKIAAAPATPSSTN